MESVRYVGLDVHRDTIAVAVLEESGKLVMQSILPTHGAALVDLVRGLRGNVHLTFEEGTQSAWLHDLLARQVARVVVCDPRQNALLKTGNKSDCIDARKLAELLRAGLLKPVYHGETGTVTVKHLGRSYATLTEDTTRTKGRIKALYRSQAISCVGKKPFGRRYRTEWLAQLTQAGMHRRAELLYEELDALLSLRRQALQELILESRKHDAVKLLRTVPFLGPIRAAVLLGRVQTPHRFRTKRQFWAYCGLALETRSSADHRFEEGQLVRAKKPAFVRGLNLNHNHDLKNLFKSAATAASARSGPFQEFYENLLRKGMQPAMARLTLARKIAAIALCVWKKGEPFDAEHVKPQAA